MSKIKRKSKEFLCLLSYSLLFLVACIMIVMLLLSPIFLGIHLKELGVSPVAIIVVFCYYVIFMVGTSIFDMICKDMKKKIRKY